MEKPVLVVSYPLEVRISPEGLNFQGLVVAIQAQVAQASTALLQQAVRAVEQEALRREPNRWVNRGQPTRHVALPWGSVTLRRTRVRDRQTGRTYNLADRLLGLRPYVRCGLDAVRVACELAAVLPYRLAHAWWQRLTGLRRSVMSFWRMVQRAGNRLVRQEREGVGEVDPRAAPPRKVRRLYLEADGVWIRRQKWKRRRGDRDRPAEPGVEARRGLLLYVGVSYSQLYRTGRKRRNALDKQIMVETGNWREFGRQWAWQVFRRFDVVRTPNQLFLSDGEDNLSRVARRWFPRALVQLDRFHVHQQLGRAFGLQTPGYRAALSALCRRDLGRVRSLLALRGVGRRRAVCQEVRTYLDRHEAVLFTHREWKRRTTVNKMGSGVVEKAIETQINRRMKKRGMSWSPAGARRLAKLRTLSADPDRWSLFWSAS